MEHEQRAIWVWGRGAGVPPSVERVEPVPWLLASAALGALAGALALAVVWRPLPLLEMPPGSLGAHAARWLACAANAASSALFADEARAYAAFLGHLTPAERAGLSVRVAIGAIVALCPLALLARPMLRSRDRLLGTRGSRRVEGDEATRALIAHLRERVRARPDHDIAPGIAYPAELWTRGVLVVGGVGSGKSTALRPLIDRVVRSGERLLLFDAKGEFTAAWAKPAILAPWDARSLAWDIARDASNQLEMERVATAMVRESHDPMWSSASRQILVGAMLCLARTRGAAWGWADLRDMLLLPRDQLHGVMQAWHPVAALAVAGASATSAGVLINLRSFCAPIFQLADAWGSMPPERRVSIREWALGRSAHAQLIIQGHGAYTGLAHACAEGIVGVYASLVAGVGMEDDPANKIWFIADEAPQLGKVALRELFSMGRSRGCRCVIAMQDLSQLEEIHSPATVKALVSLVGTLIVGQTMQGESADALCKAFGTREVERPHAPGAGHAGGPQGFSKDEVALYKPTELGSRLGLSRDRKSVRLILFTGGVAYELSWPMFPMRAARAAHKPARWIRPIAGPTPAGARRKLSAPKTRAEEQLALAGVSGPKGDKTEPKFQREPRTYGRALGAGGADGPWAGVAPEEGESGSGDQTVNEESGHEGKTAGESH
jgi:hypothetical protein